LLTVFFNRRRDRINNCNANLIRYINLYPFCFANTPFKTEKDIAEIRIQGEILFYFEDLTLIQFMFTALRSLFTELCEYTKSKFKSKSVFKKVFWAKKPWKKNYIYFKFVIPVSKFIFRVYDLNPYY